MKGHEVKQATLLLAVALALSALLMGSCGGSNGKDDGGSGSASGDRTGVTDTEIRIGTLLPVTGVAAAWGVPISKGMQAYVNYINAQGGIYGRKLKLYVGDNQYSGPVASEAVRKLVEQDQVFLIEGSLGTEAEAAVYKYLEERGIPDIYILTANSTWTVPVARNRFTSLMDYTTEGRTFARYVFQNYNGEKLGLLVQNDDYGKEGENGIRDELKNLGANVAVTTEYYDVSQNDVTAQVQRLKAAGVDVVLCWGGPVQCANMMKTARQTLSWGVPMIINSTNANEITATLAGYDNIEGTISAIIGLQAWQTDRPGVAERKAIMAQYAPDVPFDNNSLVGYVIVEGIVGFLKQAGQDLTRESFLDAMESLCKYMCDTCLVPSSTSPTDHRLVEAEILVKATVDRSTTPPTFRWEPFGEPIDYESTKDCVPATPPPGGLGQPGPPLAGEKK